MVGFPGCRIDMKSWPCKIATGHTSWPRWLAGKALPLAIFILFSVASSLALQREAIQIVRQGIHLYSLMELLRHVLSLGFLLLIVAAYFTRTHAVATARGFWEKAFPLLVLVASSIGLGFIGRAGASHRLELVGAGFLLILLGYSVSLWALWHLRGSFAIMAEARSPVISGLYRYVRHPLYLGETLTLLGLCLLNGTAIALFFWAAVTAMQLTRARIEEAKLSRQFADYQAYLERTRFILPGLY